MNDFSYRDPILSRSYNTARTKRKKTKTELQTNVYIVNITTSDSISREFQWKRQNQTICECIYVCGKSWSLFSGCAISYSAILSHFTRLIRYPMEKFCAHKHFIHIIRFHRFNVFIIISLEFPLGFRFISIWLSLSL